MKKILLIALISTGMMSSFQGQQQERRENTPLFSFGVFADAQYCDCEPEGTRFFRNSAAKLDTAMEMMVAENPEFIINLGDLIEKDFSSFAPMISVMEKYKIRIIHCPGNHDYAVEKRYFRKLPFVSLSPSGFYSFVSNGFRFVVLNGNEISTYGPGNNRVKKQALLLLENMISEGKPNALGWNGGLSGGQLAWFEKELETASSAGEKVFVICHFPVWPVYSHVLLNYEEVLQIIGRHDNIIAWFAGHDHRGGYGNYNLIHCVTFRGMVETPDENSYAIVDVYRNKIWIRGYGREKSRILAY